MKQINKNKLFFAACISLIVTSMTFAIRAGILTQLGVDFEINNTQLGYINSMAFLGFPLAMLVGGLLYNALGPKKLLITAFVCHLLGLVLTIYAGGFWTLIISTFFIGFANGSVEAACNPMIADMYTKMNSSRAYVYAVARACDRGEVTRQDAAACVLMASEEAMNVAHQAVQAMGGTGFMNDSAVSRMFRDAKLMEIGAGTSEIRRMLIGREMMQAMR